jgi:RNA polymerase sigma factor (sigma-70 family)
MTSFSSPGPGHFATTHWSIVLAAGARPSAEGSQALAALCESYWYPLYAYVRRRGLDAHEAQDLTQDFFAHLLSSEAVCVATPERGRFRSFLLASLHNFLSNHWRKENAQKRGGGKSILSLDLAAGEQRYIAEPAHDLTPEKIYERRWALTVLQQALETLSQEYAQDGKATLFEQLKPYLGGASDALPYAELAAKTGLSVGSIKVAVHRLRRRCGDLLREQIAQTVDDPSAVDQELRDLFAALRPD